MWRELGRQSGRKTILLYGSMVSILKGMRPGLPHEATSFKRSLAPYQRPRLDLVLHDRRDRGVQLLDFSRLVLLARFLWHSNVRGPCCGDVSLCPDDRHGVSLYAAPTPSPRPLPNLRLQPDGECERHLSRIWYAGASKVGRGRCRLEDATCRKTQDLLLVGW